MSTQEGANVSVCAVRGNFDDAQSAVKRIFADRGLADRLAAAGVQLSSANSINVGRLVPQVVYYFAAYAQLLRAGKIQPGDAVEFCVPTGNFGDILAGYYAQRLGLPVAKLIVASDKNNVLFDFLTTGTYDRERPFYTTTSPSMDILISSNLERMLYYLADGDCELVADLMAQLAQGSYNVPAELLARSRQSLAAVGRTRTRSPPPSRIAGIATVTSSTRTPPAATTSGPGSRRLRRQGPRGPLHRQPYKFPRAVAGSLGLFCRRTISPHEGT